MSGTNQHHLPQMLQRGFQPKGVRGHTWLFKPGAQPSLEKIDGIGAEDFFYSESAPDEASTLDGRITRYESERLGRLLNELKQLSGTAQPDADKAAEVVAHLAVRTGHFRTILTAGVEALGRGAVDLFSQKDIVFRHFGFDGENPTDRFSALLQKIFDEQPQLAETGIRKSVLARMAFVLGREQFGANWFAIENSLRTLGDRVAVRTAPMVRDGHNNALSQDFIGGARKAKLQTLRWEIVDISAPGVILPDCGSIAITDDGEPLPFMMADLDRLAGVVAPISSRRMLLGRTADGPPFDLDDINRRLAACCDEFFIAASDTPEFFALSDAIGTRSRVVVDDALAGAFKDYDPVPIIQTAEAQRSDDLSQTHSRQDGAPGLDYQMSFYGCGDEDTCERIAAHVEYLVSALSPLIPLSRLDGITFAADYPGALTTLDRGAPGLKPPTTLSVSEGVGIAQAPLVIRDGIVKARIIAQAWIGQGLVSENDELVPFAVHTLAHQLAQVAMVHFTDTALPDFLLRPVPDALNKRLYGVVSPAPDSYFAARFAAPYAPSEIEATYRKLSTEALRRLQEVIPAQRIAYRLHGDLDRLLEAVLPAVRSFLHHVATLAGHRAGLEPPIAAASGEFEQELERSGLKAWLDTFQSDLAKFADRAGQWESVSEFFDFTQHAERILWHYQIIPWEQEDGRLYVTIPLAVDAPALELFKAMMDKAPKDEE